MEYERSAGVIVFRNKDSDVLYLVLQYGSGHWDFAKGNIEQNEQARETAIREAREETGLSDTALVEGFEEREAYFYRNHGVLIRKEVVYFLGRTESEAVTLSFEHKDFRWAPFVEALALVTHKNTKELLQKAHAFLRGGSAAFQKKIGDYHE